MEWTPEKLVDTARSFWLSSVLQTAVKMDLFSPLAEGPLTEAELAARLDCSVRGAGMLVTVLASVELVRREGDRVALTPFARRHLCRDSDAYLGHIINHLRHLVPLWSRLDEAVRSGTCVHEASGAMPFSDEKRESFLLGMLNMFMVQAGKTVPQIPLAGRKRLLDLGGGTGSYAVQFCRHNPHLSATVFDLPTSQTFAERHIAAQGLADRIVFVPGDFQQDALPSGFDAAWLSHILHGVGPEAAAGIVRKAAHSLTPGGVLLIQEFVVDDSRDGPLYSALFGVNMLVNTPDGMAYTTAELSGMLRDAGAERIERLPLELPGGLGIVAGVIPG